MTLLALTAVQSEAMVFGIRFSNTQEQPLYAVTGIDGPGSKGRFGIYVGQQSGNNVFLAGINYDRYKMLRADTLLYSRRYTIDLGYRFQLLPADKARAMSFMPFLALHLFKSFSKVEADSAILSPAEVKYLKDISNDDGGWISAGGEYFFAPVFSLGAEAGLRYTRANSNAYGNNIKIRQYDTFIALLMSFWLQ